MERHGATVWAETKKGENMTVYRLILMSVTPSLNEWQRAHWSTRANIKKDWEWILTSAICKYVPDGLDRQKKKARVILTRHGPRLLDHDNLAGGCKPLFDAMTNIGLIVDDCPKWLDATVRQKQIPRKDNPHMTLELEYIEDDTP